MNLTREESKEKYVSKQLCPTQYEFIIDSLYDEFESRTCSNCKYWKQKNSSYCNTLSTFIAHENFGCTEFKMKEDEMGEAKNG